MLNYKFVILCLFLYGCADDTLMSSDRLSPQSKEYSSQDIDEIYRNKLFDERRKKRLAEHKDLALYDEFSNRLEKNTTKTEGIESSELLANNTDKARDKSVAQIVDRSQLTSPSKVIKKGEATSKEGIYTPIIIGATVQKSAIERWGKAGKKSVKKNIRAGYRISSNLTEVITSSDRSPTIFKIASVEGEYQSYASVTISCDYRYNPVTQRMNFVCRNFESKEHQINVLAEILDRDGNKGLSGRVYKKKVSIIESATYAGLQDSIQKIGSSNPVQKALQAGVTASVKKPQAIIKEVLHVYPQPVVIHFLSSF